MVVVANREPYIHNKSADNVKWIRPASGLVTALDPIMRATGGVWVAHGSGSGDRETADERGRLRVPPNKPAYTLRRIWLSKEEEEGYYYGFANRALWPLCHIAYTRPVFNAFDWDQYVRVNNKFAEAVLEEIEGSPAIVLVQDYHFALLPRIVKMRRPDSVISHFWHIPWPHREAFRICPWQEEILDGLLGSDLLGFHVQLHCNNFLETVDRLVESRVDYERFSVTRSSHETTVRPFPISIDMEGISQNGHARSDVQAFRKSLGLKEEWAIALGVDRMDYTKGIPERLRAIDRFLERYPVWRSRFVFLQMGAPSRTEIREYRDLNNEVDELTAHINAKYETAGWKPICLSRAHHGVEDIFAGYRAANVCVVSSLHDGMNLVAKEFVAARDDRQGVLILSPFTGAAREMPDALLVNPYATDAFADALNAALTMPADEQQRRMQRMRAQVAEHNIFRWAGLLLTETFRLAESAK
ncbi:MAG TPA: trehalose-6-phosphate synthase [Vicinamibacterales bacterium]|nr:trehalose-6-phosphate synthase [Vicinamibacterales bacterium]